MDLMTPENIKDLKDHNGFIYNTRRGTAYFFSCEALMNFLDKNGLSHVIRAHEVQENGFQVCRLGYENCSLALSDIFLYLNCFVHDLICLYCGYPISMIKY